MHNEKHSALVAKLAHESCDTRERAPRVVVADPGWRVIVHGEPDTASPNGTMMIANVAVWFVDGRGVMNPAILDGFTPVLAATYGRIVGLVPPGSQEPLGDNGIIDVVVMRPERADKAAAH